MSHASPVLPSAMALVAFFMLILQASASTTLFGGGQQAIFPDAPQACLDALDTPLECAGLIHVLSFDIDKLRLKEPALSALCTEECTASLKALETSVDSACGSWDFPFNGGYMSMADVISLYQYKYDTVCLRNIAGDFCLMVEDTWNITALDEAGNATWPTHTTKLYPNWDNEDGAPSEDIDGEPVDDSAEQPRFQHFDLERDPTVMDFYGLNIEPNWQGHGWPDMLEYDEYPLEIQCSECFLAQYKNGLESKWGELYDVVSAQTWENIKRNCDIDWELRPANDFSTRRVDDETHLLWSKQHDCHRVDPDSCEMHWNMRNRMALKLSVSSASLWRRNSPDCRKIDDEEVTCIPEPCDVTVVQETIDPRSFVDRYPNFTVTQFLNWNPDVEHLSVGDVVCVGPPGGTYKPDSVTVARRDL